MNRKAWYSLVKLIGAGFWGKVAVAAAYSASFTFSNTNFITINDSLNPPTVATPYPSALSVTGLPGRVVTKATVTLHGLTHSFPSDVTVLLVGPQGQQAILMSDVGGQSKYSVTDLTLTFDDDSTNSLPIDSSLTSGTFAPTNGYVALGFPGLLFDLPPPAPPGNSNSPSALAVFKNTDPNGPWNLFVVDDVSGDAGNIANGWSLTLLVEYPLQISRSQTNIVLSWPASLTNGQLQWSPTLSGSGAWSNVMTAPVPCAGRLCVTNPLVDPSAFYRLVTN